MIWVTELKSIPNEKFEHVGWKQTKKLLNPDALMFAEDHSAFKDVRVLWLRSGNTILVGETLKEIEGLLNG